MPGMRVKSRWLRKWSGGHTRRGHTPAAATAVAPTQVHSLPGRVPGSCAERPAPPRTFESWSRPLVSKTTLPQLDYREVTVNTARARQNLSSVLQNHVLARPPPEKPRQGAVCRLTWLPLPASQAVLKSWVGIAQRGPPGPSRWRLRQRGFAFLLLLEAFLCVSVRTSGTLLGSFPPTAYSRNAKEQKQVEATTRGALSSSPSITPATPCGPRGSGRSGWVGATLFFFRFPQTESPCRLTCAALSRSVVSDSLRPHPWTVAGQEDSPGKNTGVDCHALFQGIVPTQGSNPGLPHCQQILYRLNYQGSADLLAPT